MGLTYIDWAHLILSTRSREVEIGFYLLFNYGSITTRLRLNYQSTLCDPMMASGAFRIMAMKAILRKGKPKPIAGKKVLPDDEPYDRSTRLF
jgi:hypothetical protein